VHQVDIFGVHSNSGGHMVESFSGIPVAPEGQVAVPQKGKGLLKYSDTIGSVGAKAAGKARDAYRQESDALHTTLARVHEQPFSSEFRGTTVPQVQKLLAQKQSTLTELEGKLATAKGHLAQATGAFKNSPQFLAQSQMCSDLEMAIGALKTEVESYKSYLDPRTRDVESVCTQAQQTSATLHSLARHKRSLEAYLPVMDAVTDARKKLMDVLEQYKETPEHPCYLMARDSLRLLQSVVAEAQGQVAQQKLTFFPLFSIFMKKETKANEQLFFSLNQEFILDQLGQEAGALQSLGAPTQVPLSHSGRVQQKETTLALAASVSTMEKEIARLQASIAKLTHDTTLSTDTATRKQLNEALENLTHKLQYAMDLCTHLPPTVAGQTGEAFVGRAVIHTSLVSLQSQVANMRELVGLRGVGKFSSDCAECEQLIAKASSPKTHEPERSALIFKACLLLSEIEKFEARVSARGSSVSTPTQSFVRERMNILGRQLSASVKWTTDAEVRAAYTLVEGGALSPDDKVKMETFVTKTITEALFGEISPEKQWLLDLCIARLKGEGSVDFRAAVQAYSAKYPDPTMTRAAAIAQATKVLDGFQRFVGTTVWTPTTALEFKAVEEQLRSLKGSIPGALYAHVQERAASLKQQILVPLTSEETRSLKELKPGSMGRFVDVYGKLTLLSEYHPNEEVRKNATEQLKAFSPEIYSDLAVYGQSLRPGHNVEELSVTPARMNAHRQELMSFVEKKPPTWTVEDAAKFADTESEFADLEQVSPEHTDRANVLKRQVLTLTNADQKTLKQARKDISLCSQNDRDSLALKLEAIALHHPDAAARAEARTQLSEVFGAMANFTALSPSVYERGAFQALVVEGFTSEQLQKAGLTADDQHVLAAFLRGQYPQCTTPQQLKEYSTRIYDSAIKANEIMIADTGSPFSTITTTCLSGLEAFVPSTGVVAQHPVIQTLLKQQQVALEDMRTEKDGLKLLRTLNEYNRLTDALKKAVNGLLDLPAVLGGVSDKTANTLYQYGGEKGLEKISDETEVIEAACSTINTSPFMQRCVEKGRKYLDGIVAEMRQIDSIQDPAQKEAALKKAQARFFTTEFRDGLREAVGEGLTAEEFRSVSDEIFNSYESPPGSLEAAHAYLENPAQYEAQCIAYGICQYIKYSGATRQSGYEANLLSAADPSRFVMDLKSRQQQPEVKEILVALQGKEQDLAAAHERYALWKPLSDRFSLRPRSGVSEEKMDKIFRSSFEGTYSGALTQLNAIDIMMEDASSLAPGVMKLLQDARDELQEYATAVFTLLPQEAQRAISDTLGKNKSAKFPKEFADASRLGGSRSDSGVVKLMGSFAAHASKYVAIMTEAAAQAAKAEKAQAAKAQAGITEKTPAARMQQMIGSFCTVSANACGGMAEGSFDATTFDMLMTTSETLKKAGEQSRASLDASRTAPSS
jgi:hypothetical protein